MSQTARDALAEFARSGDEAAFRRAVEEFAGLVLGGARRRVGDAGLAEEVAQNVFAILARKAKAVARHASISAWLHTTTRLESAKALRGRQRHRRKLEALAAHIETAAATMEDEHDTEAWRDALPHLEAALDRLPEADRKLLLARYFEGRGFRDLARDSGRSEAACKMRVRRALDRLGGWMARRGVTLPAAALAAGLTAEWAKAAPAATAASLSAQAAAAAPAVGAGALITNTILTMNATKTAALAAAAALAVGAVPLTIQGRQSSALRGEVAGLRAELAGRGAAAPGIAHSGGAADTPARQFLASARLPADPEDFVDQLLDAVMAQDTLAMMRVMVALAKLDGAGLDGLAAAVRDSAAQEVSKRMVLSMLMALNGAVGGGTPGEVAERALADGLPLSSLAGQLASWAEDDPAAALTWFRGRRAEGALDGKGLGETPAEEVLVWMLPGLAKGAPEDVLQLVAELPEEARRKTIPGVVGAWMGDAEGRARASELLLGIADAGARRNAFDMAMSYHAGPVPPDAAAAVLEGLGLDPADRAFGLCAIARGGRSLPIAERLDWLGGRLAELGAHDGLSGVVSRALSEGMPAPELAAWVDAQPAGPMRDEALAGEAGALAGVVGGQDAALARAAQIADPELRASVISRLRPR